MIADAIYNILSAIEPVPGSPLDVHASIALSDDEENKMPKRPFAVHKERMLEIERTKDGIVGYRFECSVIIIHDEAEAVDTLREQVISTMEATTGTVAGTDIELIENTGNDGPQWDDETHTFYDNIYFEIETLNK